MNSAAPVQRAGEARHISLLNTLWMWIAAFMNVYWLMSHRKRCKWISMSGHVLHAWLTQHYLQLCCYMKRLSSPDSSHFYFLFFVFCLLATRNCSANQSPSWCSEFRRCCWCFFGFFPFLFDKLETVKTHFHNVIFFYQFSLLKRLARGFGRCEFLTTNSGFSKTRYNNNSV